MNDATLILNCVTYSGCTGITFTPNYSLSNFTIMKTQELVQFTKKIYTGILWVTMVFIIASCSTNVSFLNSSIVPAANGTVTVKKDNNQNHTVKVEIKDLAPVERLQTSKETYVVWLETEKGNYENIGQLVSSTGFMSKQHTASLETQTSFKPVRIFVTAENGLNVRYPDPVEILTTDKFYK